MAAAGLDEVPLQKFCQEMQELSEKLGLPGYSLEVTRGGRRAFCSQSGSLHLHSPEAKVDEKTLFRLYSMTKAIVSVALMTFYDEGLFQLDDPISRFLGNEWASGESGGLRVAASDGVVRGTPGEDAEDQVVGPEDTAFLFCAATDAHVDVDPAGVSRCRWRDNGDWQALRMEPVAPGFAAIKVHTGRYLDVVDGRVGASSVTPVAWMLRITPAHAPGSSSSSGRINKSLSGSSIASLPSSGDVSTSGELTAGTQMRLKHQASGLWLQVDAASEDRQLITCPDVASASAFSLEKQSWRIPFVEPAVREITVRHLLTHTSGLDYSGQEAKQLTALDALYRPLVLRCEAGEVTTLEAWCSEIVKLPLRCQPGSRFQYGVSTDVVGRLCEIFGGAPLDEVLRRRVLEPLGMHSTTWGLSPELAQKRLASLYKLTADPLEPVQLMDDPLGSEGCLWAPPRGPATILGGGGGVEGVRGGLVSNASEYMRFCHMLRGKGELYGKRILRESTVELMTEVNHLGIVLNSPSATIGTNDCRGWGLLGGIERPSEQPVQDFGRNPGTYGWGGWASTLFRVNPDADVCIVFMTNCIGLESRVEKLLLRCVGEAIRGPGARPSAAVRWLRGLYAGRPSCSAVGAAVLSAAIAAALLTRQRSRL